VIYGWHEGAFKNVSPMMYEAIIVLGGRAGVYEADERKWLQDEIDFIKDALKHKVPILGICLGSQLLAHCSGGKVFPGTKGVEIGYQQWTFKGDEDKLLGIDENEEVAAEKEPIVSAEVGKSQKEDPFLNVLKSKEMDKYIILFHGDTFSLPEKCEPNGQNVELLAETNKYLTFFKVGKYSYGFQGHPELDDDLIRIWCNAWGESFLSKAECDLEKDVIEYSKKNGNLIKKNSRTIFDTWIDIALLQTGKAKKVITMHGYDNSEVPGNDKNDDKKQEVEDKQETEAPKNEQNEDNQQEIEDNKENEDKQETEAPKVEDNQEIEDDKEIQDQDVTDYKGDDDKQENGDNQEAPKSMHGYDNSEVPGNDKDNEENQENGDDKD